jgi:hypothetical protein
MPTRSSTGSPAGSGRPVAPMSPYHLALPGDPAPAPDPLRLRLDFHAESVVLTDYRGKSRRVRLVSALDVAGALAGALVLESGLLPPDALWWARTPSGGAQVAVWRAPRVWAIRLREAIDVPPRRLRLPMPGLVFVCGPVGQAPRAFAARARPARPDDRLYWPPTYNILHGGRVCVGSHQFPADPGRVPEEFFKSFFSRSAGQGRSRRHPDDVGRLWDELDGAAEFPLDDLVPALTVADAMRLGE